jgi:hypothetical protein
LTKVTVHECEQFNDKDKGGNPIPDTFHQERYDNQFPGKGVPVSQTFNRKEKTWSANICPWCGKDVSNEPEATREQRNYLEGKA